MLRMRLIGIRAMVSVGLIAAAALWAGCSGNSELSDSPPGTGGASDSDASTGGTGGTSGTGGTGAAGSGGTATGGAAGSGGMAGSGGVAGSGGTMIPPDASGFDVEPDISPPDALACLVFGEDCDSNGEPCCDPLACVQGPNGSRCRLEPTDAGLDAAACALPQQECVQLPCCPGLDCIPQGPTAICRMPQLDGGMPEGGLCHDLFEACGQGLGPCCQGLECKTDPPDFPDRQCLPPQPPDPDDCPMQEPQSGEPCSDPGLQCPYGMTVCMCYLVGWQCAY